MEDLIKKVFYTGVGLVSTTREKIQENIDELVSKGKISEEEGKKVVDDILENTEAKKDEVESKVKDVVAKVIESLNLPTKTDIDELNKRLAKLEKKVNAK